MGRHAIFSNEFYMAARKRLRMVLSTCLSGNVKMNEVLPFFQESPKSGKVGKSGGQENSEHEVG